VTALFRDDLTAAGSKVSNTSTFSPFWKFIDALLGKFFLLIRTLIIETVLPDIFLKTASGPAVDTQLWREGEERLDALKTVGLIEFTRDGSTGDLPVAAGVVIESPQIDGTIYRMITTEAVTIPDGTLTYQIQAEAEYAGDKWNLADGYYSILPVAVPGIVGVANLTDWIITPGRETESDDDARDRAWLKKQAAPYKKKFHTSTVYKLIVEEGSEGLVKLDHIIFQTDAPRGPGSADIYFYLESGIPSATLVQQVDALVQQVDDYINVEENFGLQDNVQAFAIPDLATAIQITATPLSPDLTAAEKTTLEADIENMIRAIFRENSEYPELDRVQPYGTLRLSKIITYLHNKFELESVTIDLPAADLVSDLELPTLSTVTITVP